MSFGLRLLYMCIYYVLPGEPGYNVGYNPINQVHGRTVVDKGDMVEHDGEQWRVISKVPKRNKPGLWDYYLKNCVTEEVVVRSRIQLKLIDELAALSSADDFDLLQACNNLQSTTVTAAGNGSYDSIMPEPAVQSTSTSSAINRLQIAAGNALAGTSSAGTSKAKTSKLKLKTKRYVDVTADDLDKMASNRTAKSTDASTDCGIRCFKGE